MKIGDLIRVRECNSLYNGKVGILMCIHTVSGFRDSYSIRIPSLTYEIGLFKEQCEVINESR